MLNPFCTSVPLYRVSQTLDIFLSVLVRLLSRLSFPLRLPIQNFECFSDVPSAYYVYYSCVLVDLIVLTVLGKA
jgi:hypothetical protein